MFDLDTPFRATDSQNNQKQLQRYVSLTIYTKLDNSVYLISLHIIIFISLRGRYSRGLIITGLHNVTIVNYSLCNPLPNSAVQSMLQLHLKILYFVTTIFSLTPLVSILQENVKSNKLKVNRK